MAKPWHQLTIEEAVLQLETDIHKGLNYTEAKERLVKFGPNQLQGKGSTPFWVIFFGQFKDLMIIVLIAAAMISGLVGEVKDATMIMVIVLLNAILGTTQQFRAEKAISALKKMTTPKAAVLREGEIIKIESAELVPGDIILLEAGSYIPADIRLISAPNFKVNESALTGESVPVEKTSNSLQKESLPVADQANMAFSGTVATYGRAKGIVIGTGMQTQVGKIAKLIENEDEKETPIQKRFHEIGKWLAGISLAVCAFIFFVGLLRGEKLIDMFLTSISLAVAAIPEGLPAVITISLALGARRMAKRKAIIRKLPAVEGLGSVTVICSDKTGTLTQNLMTVTSVIPLLENERRFLLTAASLCNDASTTIGDPTEKALVIQAQEEGLTKSDLENEYPRLAEVPFDSDRKMMTTLHRKGQNEFYAFSKGALEIILDRTGLAQREKEKVLAKNLELVSAGERTLGIAYRKYASHPETIEENSLTFLGFIAMADPPRPEAFEAVKTCKTAHIRPIMITGDHKLTALAIARELGIAEKGSSAITGEEIEKISFDELKNIVKTVSVFARVSPEHKIKIVDALKENGEIVAMTGDGVNDAPALKKADIGVAMGLSGTDVARESADMILTDDNFATIVSAIEAGRGIYDNILKFIRYMLSTNSGEVFTMFLSMLFNLPIPLLPIHLLWVNLVTDGLPAVALSVEPFDKSIMERKPRDPKENVFSGALLSSVVGIGLLMAIGTLGLFAYYFNIEGLVKARTVAFTTLALLQMAHVLNCRSLDKSIFKIGLFSNIYLVGAILSTLALQIAVIYLPFFQFAFSTVPLNAFDWLLILGVTVSPIVVVEIRKLLQKK